MNLRLSWISSSCFLIYESSHVYIYIIWSHNTEYKRKPHNLKTAYIYSISCTFSQNLKWQEFDLKHYKILKVLFFRNIWSLSLLKYLIVTRLEHCSRNRDKAKILLLRGQKKSFNFESSNYFFLHNLKVFKRHLPFRSVLSRNSL